MTIVIIIKYDDDNYYILRRRLNLSCHHAMPAMERNRDILARKYAIWYSMQQQANLQRLPSLNRSSAYVPLCYSLFLRVPEMSDETDCSSLR